MTDALSGIEAWARRVEAFADEVRAAPPKVAELVARELRAGALEARAPDGTRWKPRADGRAALRGAAGKIRVVATGSTVVATISGVEARHSLGAVRGGVARPILPTKRTPGPMVEGIRKVYRDAFARTLGGGR